MRKKTGNSRVGAAFVIARIFLSTTIVLAGANFAAAIAPIPTPVPFGSARPLVVNRPIFVSSAPRKSAVSTTVGRNTTLPKHRQPLPAPAKKADAKAATGAAAMPINRSTPTHRQSLGW